jgi:hypothetical protein
MTPEEINALKLGTPIYDIAAFPAERVLKYGVLNIFGEELRAEIFRRQRDGLWDFRVWGKLDYLPGSGLQTPDEALEALKNWLTDHECW